MLIHDRFVFLHLPKTGGTFIATALINEMPAGCLQRGAPGKLHPNWADIPREARGRNVLVYVRNPWDWYVSWYHFVLARVTSLPAPEAVELGDFATTIRAACSGEIDPIAKRLTGGRREGDFYTERFRRCCGEGLESDRLVFGRFEALADDLARFLANVGAPLDEAAVARIRRSAPLNTTSHRPYRDYYDADLRDLVAESCGSLIERFGYSF